MVPANGKELETQIREIRESILQRKAIEVKYKSLYDVNKSDIRFLPELWDCYQKTLGHRTKPAERKMFIFLFIFLYAPMCIYDNKALPRGWRDVLAFTLKTSRSNISRILGRILFLYSGQEQERAYRLLCTMIRQIVPGTPLYMSIEERIAVLNAVLNVSK